MRGTWPSGSVAVGNIYTSIFCFKGGRSLACAPNSHSTGCGRRGCPPRSCVPAGRLPQKLAKMGFPIAEKARRIIGTRCGFGRHHPRNVRELRTVDVDYQSMMYRSSCSRVTGTPAALRIMRNLRGSTELMLNLVAQGCQWSPPPAMDSAAQTR